MLKNKKIAKMRIFLAVNNTKNAIFNIPPIFLFYFFSLIYLQKKSLNK